MKKLSKTEAELRKGVKSMYFKPFDESHQNY